ncbi:MAG: aspartate dehydrogenase [Pseudomonadota bacterium]
MTVRIGIIGFGSIAQDLVSILMAQAPESQISILVRPGRDGAARDVLTGLGLSENAFITSDLGRFLEPVPSVVAECAGHGAVTDFGESILAAGADLVVASVGVLADPALYDRLREVAARSTGQLVIPSGAIGGVDILSAARLSGLTSVDYTGRKPPAAWAGTPADGQYDLKNIQAPTTIFQGNAREAAISYPKNANVAATLALAGLGMDATRVTLIADPSTSQNVHEFSVVSPAVEATVQLVGKPSPRNPKTSQTTALSIARAVLNQGSAIVI